MIKYKSYATLNSLLFRKCLYCTNTKKEKSGVILGVYDNQKDKPFVLTRMTSIYNDKFEGKLARVLESVGPIKKGTSLLFWEQGGYDAVAVVGLGKFVHSNEPLEYIDGIRESTRVAVGVGMKNLMNNGITDISVDHMDCPEAAAEGAYLSAYRYQCFKTKKKTEPTIKLYDDKDDEFFADLWTMGAIGACAQNWARTLMETPANLMTPTIFAEVVAEVLTPLGVKVTAHDKKWAEDNKMGAFLAVAKGSKEPLIFLEICYNGRIVNDGTKPMILIGKGVTFDSGGISLKPPAGMDSMRADMGGAACVVAAIKSVAQINLPVNVVGLIPLCENMIGSNAIKPGDVVTARNGKTICIDNTDAEGRLILADALCYAKQFDPAWVLDIATLTGAMRVALGGFATGGFCTDQYLWETLQDAGRISGDRVWRFPLFKHYVNKMTDHSGYDINNVGKGGGGACLAAAFLSQFRPENVPWIHLDIAGVNNTITDQPYLRKGMTGRPTRTLIEFLKNQTSGLWGN